MSLQSCRREPKQIQVDCELLVYQIEGEVDKFSPALIHAQIIVVVLKIDYVPL